MSWVDRVGDRRSWAILARNFSVENESEARRKIFLRVAAMTVSISQGPLRDFYENLLAKGRKPTMARLTLATKIAAITLIVWKKEVRFDANYLKQQA
jgi:hypothetical protein